MKANMCEYCLYYEYDEICGEWVCVMDMSGLDQDEAETMYCQPESPCPFYRMGDEYTIARKQN